MHHQGNTAKGEEFQPVAGTCTAKCITKVTLQKGRSFNQFADSWHMHSEMHHKGNTAKGEEFQPEVLTSKLRAVNLL